MLATALVSFREGVEAFLIVALTLAYLKQSGRLALTPAVYAGTAAGVALSFVAGWFFAQADNKPFWEGLLAAVAAAMWRHQGHPPSWPTRLPWLDRGQHGAGRGADQEPS